MVFATDPSGETTGVFFEFRLGKKVRESTYNSLASFPDPEARDLHQKTHRRVRRQRCGLPNIAGTDSSLLERNRIPLSGNRGPSTGAARCWLVMSKNLETMNVGTHQRTTDYS